jgi:hypothetical protein
MTITPDTKDWTWVLQEPCPECGYDAQKVAFPSLPDRLGQITTSWQAVLQRAGVRQRTNPDRWSELEYGCHVRDVFRKFVTRLAVMVEEDDPVFANWDQDATAIEDRYDEQDPAEVSRDLAQAGTELAESFRRLPATALARTGMRSDGARFTVETLGLYLVHDPVHHLWDVGG